MNTADLLDRPVGKREIVDVMKGETLNLRTMSAMTGHAPRWIVLCASVALLSACATTGGPQSQARQAGKEDCSSTVRGRGDCMASGVIEISENFGVDGEIREEFRKAVTLLNEEKYPEAIALLKAVTGKTSKFSAPYINLGIAYERTGEMDKAEESLKKALEINGRHPVAGNELGMVYRKTGRYQEAREIYQSTLRMYPDFLPAIKNLGVLCDIYLQDLNCALEEYDEYLKRLPDDEKVKIWVADVKGRMK